MRTAQRPETEKLLDARVSRLERENRTLKKAIALLLAIVGVATLIGSITYPPEQLEMYAPQGKGTVLIRFDRAGVARIRLDQDGEKIDVPLADVLRAARDRNP